MEEAVADQAGGTRRPARASRRRSTGRRAPEAGDDTNLPQREGAEGHLAAEGHEDDLPDDKFLEKITCSLLVWSVLLVWAKAQPFINPPAWLSAAREAAAAAAAVAGGGEQQLPDAARLYEFLSALSMAQEGAIAFELCLFELKVVSASRALTAVTRFMVASLVSTVAAAAACAAGATSSGGWSGMAPAFMPLVAAAAVVVPFVIGKLEELREMFRG